MPIYDYRCDHCGHVFSAVQSFSDDALDKCPSCGKQPRRLLSMPAIVFKGSGWYKTDSRPAEKGSADGSASTDKKGDSKSETKGGDSKGEAKTETKSDKKADKSDKSDKSGTKAPEKSSPKSDAAS